MKDLKANPAKPSGVFRVNKRFYIIFICLAISSIFWLLLALSRDYPVTIIFPVEYINLPGEKVVMNDLPSKISVQLKASGFRIISFGIEKEHDPVKVDVAGSMLSKSVYAEVLSLPTRSFLHDFSSELGNEVSITGFQPDSIVFNFSNLTTRRIPIVLSMQASFDNQYDSTGRSELNPSEVVVSGPPSVVEGLKAISTENIKLVNLKETVKMKVKLIGNRLLSYNVNEVELTLPVEKFTEGSAEIEIHPVNVSAGYSLKTFPDKVKVRYLVALSRYNSVDESMFDAIVDGGELERKHSSKLDVKIMTSPDFVRVTILEPEKVDYILRRQ